MGLVENDNTTHVAKEGDEISSTELGQESCVKKKKKPRRVSFAEITSVHVFDRDEDYETPPDNKPTDGEDRVRTLPGGSPRPSLKLLHDEDDDDHLQSTPTSGLHENESEQFVHEADTPGSTSGGGTPGEEGEFFGPVSLWHIAPGMSARSPLTDDITLDCTTFSLQFGKLMVPGNACVNPMEDVKTPAVEIEGRTPATEDFKTPVGETGGPSLRNSMVLTKPKQPVSRRLVSDDDTLGNVEGMDDMKMTEENQFKFDFANMHPDLDSLLAQKISELQPTISSKEQNQGWQLSGSSHPQQKIADALTDSTKKNEDTNLSPDEEANESTFEIMSKNDTNITVTLSTKNNEDTKLIPVEEANRTTIEIISKNGESTSEIFSTKSNEHTELTPMKSLTIGILSAKNGENTKLMPDEEVKPSSIEIASKNGKNTIGTFSAKTDEDTKLDLMKRATTGTLSTQNNKDTRLSPYAEMNLSTGESISGSCKNTTETFLFKNIEDIKLTADEEVKQQQRLGFLSPGQGRVLKSYADEEVHGPSIEINATRCYNDTKAPYIEIIQSTVESASAKQNKDTKVMPVDDSSFIQFEEKQQQKQKEIFWDAEGGIELRNPVNAELRGSMSEIMSGNNYSKGKSRTDLDSMAKHSYGLIESSVEHDAYSSHAKSENQENSKGENQKEYFLIQKVNREGIGKEGTGKNLFSNKYEDSAVKQSGSIEHQEIHACHIPLKAMHSFAEQSDSGKLQEICAHFTPSKVEGSVVKQSGSEELQEILACYTPLKALDSVSKQSGSGKLQEIRACHTPLKALDSVAKQSGSGKLQEIRACYTPLKALDSVAKQSGSGKLQEIRAHFTPTKAEGSVVKQSGSVKLYTHSNTRAMNEEETISLVPLDLKTKIDHGNNMLFLSQRESSSTHSNISDWQRYQKHQTSDCSTDHVAKELQISQHSTIGICLKRNEFLHDPEKTLLTPVFDGTGCHGKKRKSEEMEVHEKGNLIKSSWNNCSVSERKPAEPGVIGNEYADRLKGPMHSIKKSSVARTDPAVYVMATSPTKSSNAPVKFSQGEEALCLPMITKPRTLQECLSFLFLQRPQLCLLQDTLKQLQGDMDMMKNLGNQQFQALDGKKHMEVENKLILPNHQSLGYVKWLQQVLAYERSKLLLLQTKKDELMRKCQELHSGREEVDRLKRIYIQKQVAFNTSGRPVMKARSAAEAEAYIQFLKAEIGKQVENFSNKKLLMEGRLKGIERENQRAEERVINMEQQLRILDNKIHDMCEFYRGFLKVERNMRKGEIAELLRNHVKKRSQATLILQDMQLWKLKEMKSKLGENFIELSYSNIISQRFVFERDDRDANIWTCLSLNHETIEKVFPFMNASAVFGLVLGSKQSCKIGGAGNICQVIQETSFLHGTLIDVLEEVLMCRSRLLNLSFTHFDCTSGCGLQLQLKFINGRMGLEARLVLDMSNLLRGVYPSDAFPLEVEILQFRKQPKSLLEVEEVYKEIRALQPGYPRIRNLCDRVSRLIERNG